MADLDTLICQNDCSGHGFCQQGIFHVKKIREIDYTKKSNWI